MSSAPSLQQNFTYFHWTRVAIEHGTAIASTPSFTWASTAQKIFKMALAILSIVIAGVVDFLFVPAIFVVNFMKMRRAARTPVPPPPNPPIQLPAPRPREAMALNFLQLGKDRRWGTYETSRRLIRVFTAPAHQQRIDLMRSICALLFERVPDQNSSQDRPFCREAIRRAMTIRAGEEIAPIHWDGNLPRFYQWHGECAILHFLILKQNAGGNLEYPPFLAPLRDEMDALFNDLYHLSIHQAAQIVICLTNQAPVSEDDSVNDFIIRIRNLARDRLANNPHFRNIIVNRHNGE